MPSGRWRFSSPSPSLSAYEGRDGKSLGEDFDTHFGTFTGINGKFVLDGKRVRLAPERG